MADPISSDIAYTLARFFSARGTPSHTELDEIFEFCGLSAFDPREDPTDTIGKERRVRTVLLATAEHPSRRSRDCVLRLLASLRGRNCFIPAWESYAGEELIQSAIRAFRDTGWVLDSTGRLAPLVVDDIPSALRRPVINLQIDRIRNAAGDPALLIGSAKELLETTSKYVIEELSGQAASPKADFNYLLYLARERLQILPEQQVDSNEKHLLQSLWAMAESVNVLRKDQGTGHGQTLLPTLDTNLAIAAVQSTAVFSQLMLARLDAARALASRS